LVLVLAGAAVVVVVGGVIGDGGAASGEGLAVGRREVTFVDPGRSTPALPEEDLDAQPDRTLETVVLYPTANVEATSESTDVRPAGPPAADGPFPLVVFAHGDSAGPEAYVPLVEPLVREGYVVALPRFPRTSRSATGLADAVDQPADVSFVIDQVLALSDRPDGWLAGRVDPDRIAVAGHALGAITAVAVTYDRCCADPRIDAAIAVAGTGVPSAAGALDDPPPTPLLLVHGVDDPTVPVAGSDELFARAGGPAWYLRLDDGDDTVPGFGRDGELTLAAMSAFLDARLRDDPEGLAEVAEEVEGSGRGEWRVRDVEAGADPAVEVATTAAVGRPARPGRAGRGRRSGLATPRPSGPAVSRW
ncbi:MAG TPA: hypothetical protein VIL36_13050, partial [Acidimicrobiales bacterium]